VASANFELYTTAGEEAGRRLISRFERLRTILEPMFVRRANHERPLCILAFRSQDEFRPYAPMGRSTGFYLPGARRDFIALQDPSANSRTAAHEYAHAVMARSGLRIPTWLNEGLAELYSNIDGVESDPSLMLGRFIDGRVVWLHRDGWIGLAALVSSTQQSGIFTDSALVDSAYSESWLLAHMLVLCPGYAGHFQDFLSALQTADTPQAIGMVYAKSLAQVEQDLTAYIGVGQANTRPLDRAPPATVQPVDVERDADFDARLALAEMLGNYRGRSAQAYGAYTQLARDYPLRPEVEEGIASIDRSVGGLAVLGTRPAMCKMKPLKVGVQSTTNGVKKY
jgi:hypothetical protein